MFLSSPPDAGFKLKAPEWVWDTWPSLWYSLEGAWWSHSSAAGTDSSSLCPRLGTEGKQLLPQPRRTWSLFCRAWAQLHWRSQRSLCSCASAWGCHLISSMAKAALSPAAPTAPGSIPGSRAALGPRDFFQRLHVNTANLGVIPSWQRHSRVSQHSPLEGCFHGKQPWLQYPVLRIPALVFLCYRAGGCFHHCRKGTNGSLPRANKRLWPLHGSTFPIISGEVALLKKLQLCCLQNHIFKQDVWQVAFIETWLP